MPVRLIAMDMDGTLLSRQPKMIPEENVRALLRAQKAGIRLALCSGRIPDDAGFFASDAGLDMAVIALNGGCVMTHPGGQVHCGKLMDVETLAAMRTILDQTGLLYGVFRENELVVNRKERDRQKADVMWGTHLHRAGGRCSIAYGAQALNDMALRGCNKVVVIDEEETADLASLRTAILKSVQGIEITSSWQNNLEMNPDGVNKGAALTALAGTLGIAMADVMAIGDNDNDVSMLQCAGWSVAMGNATAAALAAARCVTLRNDENGVAAAISTLAFGEAVEGVHQL